VRRYDINMRNCGRGVIAEMVPRDEGRYVFISDYDTLSAQCASQERELAELREEVTGYRMGTPMPDASVTLYSSEASASKIAELEQAVAERDARIARLELALATERGKLEQADAVADSWARDAARYRWLREDPWRLKQSRDGAFDQMCTGIPKSGPECLDAAIDAAIEAAGRKEGGEG
jgi:hypothetical protein